MMNDRSNIKAKLHNYESECKRYNLPKIGVIQKSIREEADAEICNFDDYAVGSLQCQLMFDTFTMDLLTPLTVISLKNNHIEHFCCHAISSFIKVSSTLKELILEGCRFGEAGGKIIASGIAVSSSIVHLNLANCNISDDGCEQIAKSFFSNSKCEELNMSQNLLGPKSAKVLAEVLQDNKVLRKLDLSHNSLYEDNACLNVLKGLKQNEMLEYLNLSWNSLGGEPLGKVLSKSIKSTKLKILKMEHNQMATFELKKLALGLKFSKTIEEVYIAGNLMMHGEDLNFVNIFNSKSPLKLLSFGRWFHLSQDAFRLLQDVKLHKQDVEVIFKGVLMPNPPREVNMLNIYADRAKYLAMKPKKKILKRDMAFFMLRLKNLESAYLPKSDFLKMLESFKAKLDDSLVDQYISACVDEQRRVDVHLMANHYLNRHPYMSHQISQV